MDKRVVANKAYLVDAILRQRVQDSLFYKQHLYATNESSWAEVVVNEVQYVGGLDSSNRPSPFLCCFVRMLEIEPSLEIVHEYLDQGGFREFKYLTALALLYCRVVWLAADFYAVHDEYIRDYRKLRVRLKNPVVTDKVQHYKLGTFDQWVDELAVAERVVDIKVPYLAPRAALATRGSVSARTYGVEDEVAEESDYESDSD